MVTTLKKLACVARLFGWPNHVYGYTLFFSKLQQPKCLVKMRIQTLGAVPRTIEDHKLVQKTWDSHIKTRITTDKDGKKTRKYQMGRSHWHLLQLPRNCCHMGSSQFQVVDATCGALLVNQWKTKHKPVAVSVVIDNLCLWKESQTPGLFSKSGYGAVHL